MKTKFLLFSILVVLFAACEKPNTPDNNPVDNDSIPGGGASEPELGLTLVKFTDVKYREQILAIDFGTYACLRGSEPSVAEELIVGTIPYDTQLPNGYWVINWRWSSSFIYPSYNVLLPDKWQSFTHWKQTWDMPGIVMPFNQYIEDYCAVKRRSIDKHLSLNQDVKPLEEYILYAIPSVWWQYSSLNDIPDEDKDRYFNEIHQQDSLHAIYVQRLTEIINDGDFENVKNCK